jgi:hypothetical protein
VAPPRCDSVFGNVWWLVATCRGWLARRLLLARIEGGELAAPQAVGNIRSGSMWSVLPLIRAPDVGSVASQGSVASIVRVIGASVSWTPMRRSLKPNRLPIGDRFGSLPSSEAVQPPPAAGDEAADLMPHHGACAESRGLLTPQPKISAVVSLFADLARLSYQPCFTIGPSP